MQREREKENIGRQGLDSERDGKMEESERERDRNGERNVERRNRGIQ
jgi:hypothetical protein